MYGYADFSKCRKFRYKLMRKWILGNHKAVFIMLNPSTATASTLDPTVKRCLDYAKRWGCRELTVVNLFALRSTDPDALKRVNDPVGPRNMEVLRAVINGVKKDDFLVCAWGTRGGLHGQDQAVLNVIRSCRKQGLALRVTKRGHPEHPLYLPKDLTPEPYASRA